MDGTAVTIMMVFAGYDPLQETVPCWPCLEQEMEPPLEMFVATLKAGRGFTVNVPFT